MYVTAVRKPKGLSPGEASDPACTYEHLGEPRITQLRPSPVRGRLKSQHGS